MAPKEPHERSGGKLGVRMINDRIWLLPTQAPSVLNIRPLSTPCLQKSSCASGVIFKEVIRLGGPLGLPRSYILVRIIESPSIQPSRADAQGRMILVRAAILSVGTADVFKRHPISPMKLPAHQISLFSGYCDLKQDLALGESNPALARQIRIYQLGFSSSSTTPLDSGVTMAYASSSRCSFGPRATDVDGRQEPRFTNDRIRP